MHATLVQGDSRNNAKGRHIYSNLGITNCISEKHLPVFFASSELTPRITQKRYSPKGFVYVLIMLNIITGRCILSLQ